MTNQLAPETIFNDVLEKSIDALTLGITEFEIKKLQRYAAPLKKIDISDWYEAESHFAALRNDFAEQDRLFEAAYVNAGDKADTVQRHLVLLGGLGRSEKLKEQFDRFLPMLRNDPQLIRVTSSLLVAAGWIFTASKFASELDRLNAVTSTPFPCALAIRDVDRSSMNEAEVSEQAIAEAVGHAHRYLRSVDALPNAIETSVIPYEEGKCGLMYQFKIDRDPDAVSEVEWQLFEELANHELPIERSGTVVFSLLAGRIDD